MTRMTVFNSPFLLGFDQLERVLDRVSKSAADGYPPYNVEHVGDDALRITLAVAGFRRDELAVTVAASQLTVRGKQSDSDGRIYLHRGIATRQFQRSFVLAEGIEVAGAELTDGLLHIDLVRPRPSSRETVLEIRGAETADARGASVSGGGVPPARHTHPG
ncbi:MAG: Hsp20 family protein [Defluviicoccus sp.]|nr:Hsp20 family protein [Defluviicoccus sp.]